MKRSETHRVPFDSTRACTGWKPVSRSGRFVACVVAALLVVTMNSCARSSHVTVGSKAFTESVILGDIATQLIRAVHADASHRKELGGTRLVWDALVAGQIDAYP